MNTCAYLGVHSLDAELALPVFAEVGGCAHQSVRFRVLQGVLHLRSQPAVQGQALKSFWVEGGAWGISSAAVGISERCVHVDNISLHDESVRQSEITLGSEMKGA